MAKKQEQFYKLKCFTSGKHYDETETCTTCPLTGDPLDVVYDYDLIKRRLNLYALKNAPLSALKYLAFYPINDYDKIISLNEGGTPLQHCRNLSKKYKLRNLYVKNEGANPTGVFKDRGTMVEITKALELGAKAVCFASTGNMAASVAAYCSIAKLPCYVLVPEGTPAGKLAQTLSYGARIIQVRGTYNDCARLAVEMARKNKFYLAGDYAFRLEGQKSQSFEIAEQLNWRAPDYLICPIGCGTNLSAIWKGFVELRKLELIDKLPKLIGVQSSGANPISKAFKKRSKNFESLSKVNTICSAVAIGAPLDGKKVLRALYESKGKMVDITDEEVLEEQQELAKEEALFVEPSGALPMAVVRKLSAQNFFKPKDIVVCIATGNGLKDPRAAVKILPDPPTIDPLIEEVDQYLKQKLYHIKSGSLKNKHEVLWEKIPGKPDLKKIIKKTFNISLQEAIYNRIIETCREFETKGKKVTRRDLQNIISEALDEYAVKKRMLEVIDFETTTSKYKESHASVKLRYGKETLIAQGKGVGTVDAIITALKRAIKNHDKLYIELTDYNVEIFSGGVDASVKVIMSAKDKNENQIIATSTSPDVIVASVNAFEKCYNFLYYKAAQNGAKKTALTSRSKKHRK